MKSRFFLFFFLVAASPVGFAAISGTVLDTNESANGGSNVTVTISPTPSAGRLLVAVHSARALSSTLTPDTPSGWNTAESVTYTASGYRVAMAVHWKIAVGDETSLAMTMTGTGGDASGTVLVFDETDLDLSAVDASGQDKTDQATDANTTLSSGSATNTTSDSLVIAAITAERVDTWNASTSWSNSFSSQYNNGGFAAARPFIEVATLVTSATGSQTSVNTTTDTGDAGVGAIVIFAASAPTTTWTDDTVDVGTTIQGTLDVAFSGAITKCVFASGDELTASNADTDSADCAQTKADFLSGGSLSNTRIAAATTASMDNASETSTADAFTFNSPDNGTTEHFGTAGNASPDPDSLYSDSDFTTEYSSFDSNADDVWVTVSSGACDFEPVQGIFECTVVPATGVVRVYDVSATDWLTESSWTVTSLQGDCQTDVVLSPLVRPIVYSPITQIFCN